jgi:hypothetical protein
MKLAELQELFWRLCVAPQGVDEALLDPEVRALLPLGGIEQVVRGDPALPAEKRLSVYANAYFFRIEEVLQDDYAVLRHAVGEDRFHNLCVDYLLACPSRSQDIARVGDRLPEFLSNHVLGAECPWASELAAFLQARARVFDLPDDPVLALDSLLATPVEAWPALRFRWQRASTLLPVTHDLAPLWRAHDGGEPAPAVETGDGAVLVWRDGVSASILHRFLDPTEGACAAACRAGVAFERVCAIASADLPPEDAAPKVAGYVLRWRQDGLLAAVWAGPAPTSPE